MPIRFILLDLQMLSSTRAILKSSLVVFSVISQRRTTRGTHMQSASATLTVVEPQTLGLLLPLCDEESRLRRVCRGSESSIHLRGKNLHLGVSSLTWQGVQGASYDLTKGSVRQTKKCSGKKESPLESLFKGRNTDQG